jgi:hypothetical protein
MKKGNKKNRKENRKFRDANLGTSNNEMVKLIKIIAIIVAFLIVFVAIAYFIDKKDKEKETTPEATEIQYGEILLANSLKQTAKNYYVLVKYEDDNYLSFYQQNLYTYINKATTNFYFTVDLANTFNKWAIGTENKLNVTNITDMRFKETALLKIKDNKIEKTFVGFEAIKNHLLEITKTEES